MEIKIPILKGEKKDARCESMDHKMGTSFGGKVDEQNNT